ncbi:MAG: hypothetical protein IJ520_04310 [Synergistaceae bacterium]|nr:hypothetical protein [Synergistaceae bacterium]
MKKSSKIILVSLMIGVMSIAGTASAADNSKKKIPPKPEYENKFEEQHRPPMPDKKFDKHAPRSGDKRPPKHDKDFGKHPPRSGDKRPPMPPKHGRESSSVKVILNLIKHIS